MAETTGIAWTDSTFNPWIGCTKVSQGCDHCYAEVLDKRHRWQGNTHWGTGQPRMRTSDANWKKPLAWSRKPFYRCRECGWRGETQSGCPSCAAEVNTTSRRVFCASLADVFDNEVPLRWRQDLMDLVADTPSLTWLFLTKRIGMARRMLSAASDHRSFFLTANDDYKPPANLWIGASVVNQEEADRDIPKLLATPAAKRFVSYEPALGAVDWKPFLWQIASAQCRHVTRSSIGLSSIDWIIVGGESTQGGAPARPFVHRWAKDVVAQCRAAGVAVFVKQLGSNAVNREGARNPYKDRAGADLAEWPEDLRVQEFPA